MTGGPVDAPPTPRLCKCGHEEEAHDVRYGCCVEVAGFDYTGPNFGECGCDKFRAAAPKEAAPTDASKNDLGREPAQVGGAADSAAATIRRAVDASFHATGPLYGFTHADYDDALVALDGLVAALRAYILAERKCRVLFGSDGGPSDECALPEGHEGRHEHEDGLLRHFALARLDVGKTE